MATMKKRFSKPSNAFNLVLVIWVFFVLGCGCYRNDNYRPSSRQNSSTPTATSNSTPTPQPSINNEEIKGRSAKGKQIFNLISSKYGLPVMFGWRAKYINILIPTKEWDALSKADQINLTYYIPDLIREINSNPTPFVAKWTAYYKAIEKIERGGEYDGLTYDSYLSQVSDLCRTCWNVTLGTVKGRGFYDDSVAVTGENVVTFRSQNEKVVEKSDEEKELDDFKEFARSMSLSEHLTAGWQALDDGYDPTHERFGNTTLARKHIKAIPPNSPEYKEAQTLLKAVIKREKERKEYQDLVIKEVKRLADQSK
jgi:hypothetical protein